MIIDTKNTKPFLRWAGGKNWLIKNIESYLPDNFNNYFEPFLGGGSIFIYLKTKGLIKNKAYLSDINPELINSYNAVKSNIDKLIDLLLDHKNEKDYYYNLREKLFDDDLQKASRFIFLNRTSFNGIYRENLNGKYNVPFGFKDYKELFDFENFRNLNTIFQGCEFASIDFEKLKKRIKQKDLVFIDPPYTVAHGLNGFVKYNQKIFSWSDQMRLNKFLEYIKEKEAYFIMTNAHHESIIELFRDTGEIYIQSRPSLVGGKGAKRAKYKEVIISNIKTY